MMMLMHHHRPKVDGHFDGLIALRLKRRACRTIEEVQGFNMSHWTTLSAGYSPYTAPAAAIVNFFVERNCAGEKLLESHRARWMTAPLQPKLHGRFKRRY